MRTLGLIVLCGLCAAVGCGSDDPEPPAVFADASLYPDEVVWQIHVTNDSGFAYESSLGHALFEERSYPADVYRDLEAEIRVVDPRSGAVLATRQVDTGCYRRSVPFVGEHWYLQIQPNGQVYFHGIYCVDETGYGGVSDPEPNQHCLNREWILCEDSCGVTTVLDEPFTQQIICGPEGPKHRGESCTAQPASEGGNDDCGDRLACIDGVCEALCLGFRGSNTDCEELGLACTPLDAFDWAGPVGVCR